MTWYDNNEGIAYPLVGHDDLAIPHSVLVDAVVHAPAAYGSELIVQSISVTALVVSVVFAIDGTPAAYATVAQPAAVHEPIPLTPIRAGVSGFCVLGHGIERERLRVDGTYQLVAESLISYPGDVAAATLTSGGHALTGLVKLLAGSGLTVTPELLRIQMPDTTVVTVTCAVISAVDATLIDPVTPCHRAVDGSPLVSAISSINGVPPHPVTGAVDVLVIALRESTADPNVTMTTLLDQLVITDEGTPCA
jgi:hypothetical protein